jgi:hypothetical protein
MAAGKIQEAIEALPEKEYIKLRKWFSETGKNGINKLSRTQNPENWIF